MVDIIRGTVPIELLTAGYGYGYGDGNGDGYGDGYGYGDGNGDGYGYGDGDKAYWLAALDTFIAGWSPAESARVASAKARGATIAFWRSGPQGEPCNGGRGLLAKVGDIQKVPGPLVLCHAGTLHATVNPPAYQGTRLWIVALYGEVVSDGEKFGALEREILGEATR